MAHDPLIPNPTTATIAPQPITSIANFTDLDLALCEAARAFQHSDDAGRQHLARFRYLLNGQFPADPYSPAYAAAQQQLYLTLSGRASYEPAVNEHSPFDVGQAIGAAFPYCSRSPATVGEQLIAQGFLIRTMNLRAGARIVEFGPGWGNTTIQLAQMGYHVTAVDIERNFIDLIRQRAQVVGVAVDLLQQDMLQFEAAVPYDAAVIFESFHHCTDHLAMLRKLHTLVAPDGLVAFAVAQRSAAWDRPA